jgi:hypothetical protein
MYNWFRFRKYVTYLTTLNLIECNALKKICWIFMHKRLCFESKMIAFVCNILGKTIFIIVTLVHCRSDPKSAAEPGWRDPEVEACHLGGIGAQVQNLPGDHAGWWRRRFSIFVISTGSSMTSKIISWTQSYDFGIYTYYISDAVPRLEHFSKKIFFISKCNRLLPSGIVTQSSRIGSC